jgi:hypothetical protein
MEAVAERQGLRKQTADLRREARLILDGHSAGSSHRLTLTLSLIFVLTAGVALYAAVSGLYMAGLLLFGETVWLEAAADTLFILLLLGLVLPLVASVWRLACLMTAPDGDTVDGLPVSVPTATLSELFYPFTSFRAYGRTMAVAMEGLAWFALFLGLPVLSFRLLYTLVIPMTSAAGALNGLLTAASALACLGIAVSFFSLSGLRAGFGYFVFVHETVTLGDVNRYFKGFRRSMLSVLRLRVSLVGWYALSVAALFVPFVFHTLPYTLCCTALYSRQLKRYGNTR